jgi:hypothetical protein
MLSEFVVPFIAARILWYMLLETFTKYVQVLTGNLEIHAALLIFPFHDFTEIVHSLTHASRLGP